MEDKWESVYNLLALNSYPSGYEKSKRQNLRRYALKFSLKDGDLFYKGRRVIKTKEEARMVFQELHSSPIGGHTGIGKTRAAICARFYWHGMTVDIENWVLECDICQKVGKPLTAVQTFQCIETLCEKTGPLDPLAQTAMDVDHDHKPVSHDHKPVSHDHKPVSHDHKPVSHDHKPVSHDHKPVSHDHKPVGHVHKPVSHVHKPVDHDHKAVDHDHKAVGHVHKPVSHDHKAVDHDRKAVGHVHKPVSHDHKAVDHDRKAVGHVHKPVSHVHKPVDHDHKAVGHVHKPVDHDHKAVGHVHKTVGHDHKPGYHDHNPGYHDHTPEDHDHKAVDHDHKPVDDVVSPAVNRIYMDYNATTPVDPEVVSVVTEALNEAWGNPSSMYLPGLKAKDIINQSRESVAKMVGGNATDIIFTSGGTEANNMVFHSVIEHFWKSSMSAECVHVENNHFNGKSFLPHIITSNVEHDSVKLVAEHLVKMGKADVTFLPVSKLTGQVEVEDVIAALRPSTCLVSVMLANNETGVIMPIREICQRVKTAKRSSSSPKILLHTDAAQAIGKICVDVQGLGVDYLTIVGHKFYAPRIGALFVKGPGTMTPLYPLLFGGGQERNFRPGTENTAMIAGLGKAAELVTANLVKDESHLLDIRLYLEQRLLAVFGKKRLHFNSHFHGTDTLPNTCNVSILGQGLYGRRVLSTCRRLLASVGAACHSDHGDQPSHILLNCGIPYHIAVNALRISLGRGTSQEDVDIVVEDLWDTVEHLEQMSLFSLEHP